MLTTLSLVEQSSDGPFASNLHSCSLECQTLVEGFTSLPGAEMSESRAESFLEIGRDPGIPVVFAGQHSRLLCNSDFRWLAMEYVATHPEHGSIAKS